MSFIIIYKKILYLLLLVGLFSQITMPQENPYRKTNKTFYQESRMRLFIKVLVLLAAMAILMSCATQHEVRIWHINDFHGVASPYKPYGSEEDQGGLAYLAERVEELRAQKPTLLVAAGDMIQGNNWANLFQGKSSIEAMNLMKFDMSGFWTYITAENPLYVTLVRDSNTWDVLAEIVLTASSGNYETWTGSVPILAETFLWCNVYGGGQLAGEDFYNAICVDLCVTAWFDGEAGGGLLLYPNPGS